MRENLVNFHLRMVLVHSHFTLVEEGKMVNEDAGVAKVVMVVVQHIQRWKRW